MQCTLHVPEQKVSLIIVYQPLKDDYSSLLTE